MAHALISRLVGPMTATMCRVLDQCPPADPPTAHTHEQVIARGILHLEVACDTGQLRGTPDDTDDRTVASMRSANPRAEESVADCQLPAAGSHPSNSRCGRACGCVPCMCSLSISRDMKGSPRPCPALCKQSRPIATAQNSRRTPRSPIMRDFLSRYPHPRPPMPVTASATMGIFPPSSAASASLSLLFPLPSSAPRRPSAVLGRATLCKGPEAGPGIQQAAPRPRRCCDTAAFCCAPWPTVAETGTFNWTRSARARAASYASRCLSLPWRVSLRRWPLSASAVLYVVRRWWMLLAQRSVFSLDFKASAARRQAPRRCRQASTA
ncbi:hypothetical protein C8Q80DRAFT_350863 [Daedaleopsis nitida]|nr:hypothetical protein C8Q80DRAFT_350863 [Daedaleopsis nitida]